MSLRPRTIQLFHHTKIVLGRFLSTRCLADTRPTGGFVQHREDIDGLRALAIIPILLFHANFNFARSGFIGVDIFFVISGYLITSIILKDVKNDNFVLLDFYKKRIARIFPVLFSVIIFTIALGLIVLELPIEFNELFSGSIYAILFSSNIYYFLSADYFSSSSETIPFLHTWSLSVEEQFYLLYPFLILAIFKINRNLIKHFIALIVIVSFILSIVIDKYSLSGSFYLLPSRIWELGIGAMVAVGLFPSVYDSKKALTLSCLGAFLLMSSSLLITKGMGFPAPWALLPCLGTAMLIAYGEKGPTSAVLSSFPFRFIGKISFSLYLWHWPIMAYWRTMYGTHLKATDGIILIIISFLLAVLSYYIIETPLQQRIRKINSKKVILFTLILVITLCTAFKLMSFNINYNGNAEAVRLSEYINYSKTQDARDQYNFDCFASSRNSVFNYKDCLSLSENKKNIVVIGDSHAAQYVHSIKNKYQNYNFLQATASGCLPVLNAKGEGRCTKLINYVIGDFIIKNRIDHVILIGRWRDDVLNDLISTIRYLKSHNINITIFGPTVEYNGDFPVLLSRELSLRSSYDIERFRVNSREVLDRKMMEISHHEKVQYFSPYKQECQNRKCKMITNAGHPYHSDYGHVTLGAANEIISNFNGLN